jgi:hypothetical protein
LGQQTAADLDEVTSAAERNWNDAHGDRIDSRCDESKTEIYPITLPGDFALAAPTDSGKIHP